MIDLAMFPLGTVLFPGSVLPLRIFEPRYLRMLSELDQENPLLGTCLIEKGTEVGGQDSRFSFGTLCQVTKLQDLGPNQVAIQCVGLKRIIVTKWLPDDPYPMAQIEELEDDGGTDFSNKREIIEELERCYVLLVQMGAIPAKSMNIETLEAIDLFTACSLAPLGQLDKYKLLSAESSENRSKLLLAQITSERETLAAVSRLHQDES
ncbi:MAG: hypothetical protein CL501_03735 [Actinobacteria bacterium]|nr:hypothetical protein [Actinomycetota bacterium]MBD29508.1 hypothetical protein [Acidimicrobiaceae bacterium]|tara:strand:- start:10 stop:630 length:621 start_codon:yes stop_codon:yes gene_type:complete